MTGAWPLTPETKGMEMPEILIFARKADSAIGATTTDRPEWILVNPAAADAYCSPTNNPRGGPAPRCGSR